MSKAYLCSCGGVFKIATSDKESQSFLVCPVCGELWPTPGYEVDAEDEEETWTEE